LKSKDWKYVKLHQWIIYASEYYGVLKAEVIEIDIKIAVDLPTFHYDYPYGLTAEKGTVKIRYVLDDVTHEIIENLAHAVKYSEKSYRELLAAYNMWQTYLSTANSYKEEFNRVLQTLKEE